MNYRAGPIGCGGVSRNHARGLRVAGTAAQAASSAAASTAVSTTAAPSTSVIAAAAATKAAGSIEFWHPRTGQQYEGPTGMIAKIDAFNAIVTLKTYADKALSGALPAQIAMDQATAAAQHDLDTALGTL